MTKNKHTSSLGSSRGKEFASLAAIRTYIDKFKKINEKKKKKIAQRI
jgi:hypothetical protein